MDQVNTVLNANLNLLVVFSLVCLSLAVLVLLGLLMSIVPQANRTLNAFEKLATTVSTELQPTLAEASKLVGGVLKLQDLAQNSMSNMTDKVEDVTDNLSRVAVGAKKGSSVIGAGILAGIKAYLNSHQHTSHRSD
jgi:predicted PurR-regulated permease PerM